MDEQRTIFQIPAENMAKFEAQIAKLSKKSVKLIGIDIAPFVFSHEEKVLNGRTHRVYDVMLTADVPKLNGWTFVARLDHSHETGTVIRMVPNTGIEELPSSFRSAKNTQCDHCNVNRFRRDTFVVRNEETGEFKQIGSTCLKDFFGHDPYKIAKLAELLGYAYECGRGNGSYDGDVRDMQWIGMDDFCIAAARAVLNHGWVSGKAAYENASLVSTKEQAWSYFGFDHTNPPTEVEIKLAEDAIAWAVSLSEKTSLSDYEHNISVIAAASVIAPRSAGLAASIVGVYFNNQRRDSGADHKINLGNFGEVVNLFKGAGEKLKYPKIRLLLENETIVLSLAGAKSSMPGAVVIKDDGGFDGKYFGRVSPEGVWNPGRATHAGNSASLLALLAGLANNPAKVAAEFGHMTGKCCFCDRALEDERSLAMGYGPVCAKNFKQPWGIAA